MVSFTQFVLKLGALFGFYFQNWLLNHCVCQLSEYGIVSYCWFIYMKSKSGPFQL